MIKFKNMLQELSIKDEIRALKVLLSAIIAIYLCSFSNYLKVSTTVITVSIVFALLPTVSGARSYCLQRVIANILGAILTFMIGSIFNWNIYSLALICSSSVFIYFKFNLNKTKLSLMSFIAGSLIFFFAMSDPSNIVTRFLSIIVGSLIAILINELILPLNQGLKVEKLINSFSSQLFDIEEDIIININNLNSFNLKNLFSSLQIIKPNITLLDKESKTNSLKNHLKHYKSKTDIIDKLGEICNCSYELLDTILKNKDDFNNLSNKEKLYIKEILINLRFNHQELLNKALNNQLEVDVSLIEINYNNFNLDNTISILLLSNFIQYQNNLTKLENSLSPINLATNYNSIEVF